MQWSHMLMLAQLAANSGIAIYISWVERRTKE
jgi:hypothetical protein